MIRAVRPLTPRQGEVVELLCLGFTGPEVAQTLGITAGTVKNSRKAIFQKLGVRSLAEACARLADRP